MTEGSKRGPQWVDDTAAHRLHEALVLPLCQGQRRVRGIAWEAGLRPDAATAAIERLVRAGQVRATVIDASQHLYDFSALEPAG